MITQIFSQNAKNLHVKLAFSINSGKSLFLFLSNFEVILLASKHSLQKNKVSVDYLSIETKSFL